MMIETVNKTYHVIGYLGQDEKKEVYLCESVRDRERYLVIRLKDQKLVTDTVEFLYGQVENKAFKDLEQCFVFEECLHLAFLYHRGESLEDKLQGEHIGLRERLELEKKILEKMVLLSMPSYFQCRCLRPGNIYVTRSLEVTFAYSVEDLEHYGVYTIRDVQDELCRVTEALFRDELKKEVIDPAEEFLAFLRQEEREDYLEIYRRYLEVYQQVLGLAEKDMEMPNTWIFRIWDRIKKQFAPLKRIIVVAILLLGLGCLIWTIGDAMKPAAPAVIMTQIGTEEL